MAKIALTIPLATAWPERGFSALKRVKTQARNRIGNDLLSALLNVSMNGPEELSDEDALDIAKKWKEAKQRRVVTNRRTKPGSGLDDDDFEFHGFDDVIDNDTFWL